jgi:hypothetical protein
MGLSLFRSEAIVAMKPLVANLVIKKPEAEAFAFLFPAA